LLTQDIHASLKEAKEASADLYIVAMNMFCKQVIRQAETEVAVKRETAFPLATLISMLYRQHNDLVPLILVRMMKRCPYIVPCYFNRQNNESNEEYMKRLGYRENGDDVLETEIQYGERMCGILSVHAAILQTDIGTTKADIGILDLFRRRPVGN
jgi:nucleoporin GLE1